MLVLGRKAGESLQIGDAITVKVLRVHAHTVRLGIDALPGEVVSDHPAAGGPVLVVDGEPIRPHEVHVVRVDASCPRDALDDLVLCGFYVLGQPR